MASLLATTFCLMILITAGLFLWQPEPAAWVGFAYSIPHWPARLLRWLFGSGLDQFFTPAANWVLRITGIHAWLHCGILAFVGFVPVVARVVVEDKGALFRWGVFSFTFLLCVPFASALLSGMHLSRAYVTLQSDYGMKVEVRVLQDLLLGMEPVDDSAPDRAIRRFETIAERELSLSKRPIRDSELENLQRQIESAPAEMRKQLATMPRDSQRDLLESLLFAQEVAVRLQLRTWLPNAAYGRGGDSEQEPRVLTFEGPVGTIQLKTRFLPPDGRMRPIIPGAFQSGQAAAIDRIKQAAKGLPQDAQRAFEEVDTLAVNRPMNDTLIRMWYSTLAHFFYVREFLSEFTKRAPSFDLANRDRYGELTINLHNSCESYVEAVGGISDIAGSGIYLSHRNEIHVWSDEQEDSRIQARHLLRHFAKEISGAGSADESEGRLLRMAASIPADRMSVVLSHELTHWTSRTLLGNLPWDGSELPPVFAEGLALVIDEEGRREFARLRRMLGVEPTQTASQQADCPSAQRQINWTCSWFNASHHDVETPAELVSLDYNEFHEGDVLQNYADAWALVYLFGESIIVEAIEQARPIEDVMLDDAIFSIPWKRIKDDIRSRRGIIPAHIVRRFLECQL